MVAQGNVLPVLYGEMRVGSRVISQEVSTRDEGNEGQMVVIGRQVNNSRHMWEVSIAPVCRAKLFHCYGARVRGCPPYPIDYGMMPQAILAPPPPSGSGWS